MTRRFGIDVSKFQDPNHPAGNTWEAMGRISTFAIVRASYGVSPDARAAAHITAARAEAFQVGLYHFFVVSQDVDQQMNCFIAQAIKCGVGRDDILPALDIEDDGSRHVTPAMEPLIRQAVDILVARFGGAMIYITQRDFGRLGEPAWILEHPLWVAHYTNASKPATPGNRPFAIWQNRVGPYAPGQPFVVKEATASNAIDQNVADEPLPLCTLSPNLSAVAPEVDNAQARWRQRIDALTMSEYWQINTGHSSNDPFEQPEEAPTKPDNPKPIA